MNLQELAQELRQRADVLDEIWQELARSHSALPEAPVAGLSISEDLIVRGQVAVGDVAMEFILRAESFRVRQVGPIGSERLVLGGFYPCPPETKPANG